MNCTKHITGVLVALTLVFTGCAYKATNMALKIESPPADFSGVRVNRESIKSSIENNSAKYAPKSFSDMFNMLIERSVYENIEKFSQGKVSAGQESDIVVSEVKLSGVRPGPPVGDMVLSVFSFFIPPLALIQTRLDYPVFIDLEFSDSKKKVVRSEKINFTASGKFWGWYLGRPIAFGRLLKLEDEYIKEKASTAILNTIYQDFPELFIRNRQTQNQ